MKVLLPLISFLITFASFSQEVYELKLEVKSSMPFKEYSIYLKRDLENSGVIIKRYTEKLKKLSVEDSLRFKMLYGKKIGIRNRDDIVEIETIIERYKIYETESISIKREHPIIRYADSITNSKKDLEEEIVQWKNRVIIDGMDMILTVSCPGDSYRIYFNSPDERIFSLIYTFWQKLTDYYNSTSEKKILEKKYYGN